MTRILLSIICVIPAALVNARAQLSMGAGIDIVLAVILFAFMAPVFTLYAMAMHDARRIAATCVWAIVAILFMSLNTTIALGGISAIRDLANDRNAEIIRSHEAKTSASASRDARIARLRASVGSTTSYELEAQAANLAGSELYLRSKRCTDVTLSDSQAMCRQLAEVNAKLSAAKEIERIEAERDATAWGASTRTEIVPQVQDAQIANISALIAPIFNVTPDHRLLAALLSGAIAIMLEIAADLGPVAVWGLIKISREPRVMEDQDVPEPSVKSIQKGFTEASEPSVKRPESATLNAPDTFDTSKFHGDTVVPFRMTHRTPITDMRAEGVSWEDIAKKLKISKSTARRRHQSEVVPSSELRKGAD